MTAQERVHGMNNSAKEEEEEEGEGVKPTVRPDDDVPERRRANDVN